MTLTNKNRNKNTLVDSTMAHRAGNITPIRLNAPGRPSSCTCSQTDKTRTTSMKNSAAGGRTIWKSKNKTSGMTPAPINRLRFHPRLINVMGHISSQIKMPRQSVCMLRLKATGKLAAHRRAAVIRVSSRPASLAFTARQNMIGHLPCGFVVYRIVDTIERHTRRRPKLFRHAQAA